MAFSVQKAVVYGIALFGGLLAGLSLGGGVRFSSALIGAALGAALGGSAAGYLMREDALDIAAATPESVEAAVRGSWQLRAFHRIAANGAVLYQRGIGFLGDRFTVTAGATGVTLRGPANIIALVKKKAAG